MRPQRVSMADVTNNGLSLGQRTKGFSPVLVLAGAVISMTRGLRCPEGGAMAPGP